MMRRVRRLASTTVGTVTAKYLNQSWQRRVRRAVTHVLPGRLAVSLTSYPPRFPTLALTIKSLLAQSMRPDKLYLWIAQTDIGLLPRDVTSLCSEGLLINSCRDMRSYKKIIPALENGDDYIVIADDDVYYTRHWLRDIVMAHQPGSQEIICTRAHRICVDGQGAPLPYRHWQSEISAGEASTLVFATGVGGVLYEPRIFHSDVARVDLFEKLCPTADDVWLYWMASLNGGKFRKIGPRVRPINWPRTQDVGLESLNARIGSANDDQIAAMVRQYGFPATSNL